MSKQEHNNELYQQLMASRQRNPKLYGLSRIGVAYEEMRNLANASNSQPSEVQRLKNRLLHLVKNIKLRYGVTAQDVAEYFERNRYELVF